MTEKNTHDTGVNPHKKVFDILRLLCVYEPEGGLNYCFRGQSDSSWELLPKSGRQPTNNDEKHGLGAQHMWEQRAVAYEELPDNVWEPMAIAQHHGLETSLLDWTLNPLVALFFACNEYPQCDGALFIYSPNRFVNCDNARPDLLSQGGLYIPRAINTRIHNQAGVFTYHPNPTVPVRSEQMEGLPEGTNSLKRITIETEWKSTALNILNTFGIHEAFLFPGLDGLSRYVNWTYRQ